MRLKVLNWIAGQRAALPDELVDDLVVGRTCEARPFRPKYRGPPAIPRCSSHVDDHGQHAMRRMPPAAQYNANLMGMPMKVRAQVTSPRILLPSVTTTSKFFIAQSLTGVHLAHIIGEKYILVA